MEKATEYQQAHCFVASHLSRNGGQDEEHVIDSIAEDRRPKGDLETNRPEGKHGEEAITGNSQTSKRHCKHKNTRTACTGQKRVDKASSESFDLRPQGTRENSRTLVE